MGRRPSFAETLDEALVAAQDGTSDDERFVYLPASAAPFVFVYSRPNTAEVAGRPVESADRVRQVYARAAGTATLAPPAETPAARMTRALTPPQQRAFDAMISLGARLRGDFTAVDLRRAFRRLAQEYHPDRHPDCTPAEQAHLSRTFADLAEHYRCLLSVFERER